MKCIYLSIALLLWIAGTHRAFAQPGQQAYMVVNLTDDAAIKVTGKSPALRIEATDPAVQAVLNRYTISDFQKAYPASRFAYMQQYYLIRASSTDLLAELREANPTLFPDGSVLNPQVLGCPPNDYNIYPQNTKLWNYVKAADAFCVTTGSPGVVVGITDTYFNTEHPELSGKIAQVRQNTPSSEHGTGVAGCIAAATNNGQGLSSMGYQTKLDISNNWADDNELLQMSRDGRRVLNASWMYGYSMIYSPDFSRQNIYNEIYENGTIPFFGAGNGASQGPLNSYVWPSSFDHNMSITSVGHSAPVGTYNTDQFGSHTDAYWEGVHNQSAADNNSAYHHNDRVDLSAPGYDVPILRPGGYGVGNGTANGTSYSAPIAAGAAALLLALKPCLSPYQIEYILKTSANTDIYGISYNAPYIGQLGAGRLDAKAAVDLANNFSCDDVPTKTFMIKGVELNTVCAPGYASNGVTPRLIPVLENGVPPYTYKWEPFPSGNSVTLDAYNIATPTIIASTAPHVAYLRLTVYDNSPIQKVANKIIKIQLKTANTYDLAMRDLYLDMLDEPNNMSAVDPRTWNVWKSPDIWNRHIEDGGLEHQPPEYFINADNHLYVKVRNVGCAPSPANKKLRLYWTMASTTESWTSDWDGSGGNYPGTSQPKGGEITADPINIDALQPGASDVKSYPWHVVNPADYDPNYTVFQTCLLARIEENPTSPYGMTIPELLNAPVGGNVINNNNIITRNTFIVDLQAGNRPSPGNRFVGVLVGNASQTGRFFRLQLINDRAINKQLAGDLSAVLNTTVYLDPELYDRWGSGDFQGTYLSKDDVNRTVTFDGSSTMELRDIYMDPGEEFKVKIHFELKPGAFVTETEYEVHFRQLEGKESSTVLGNVTYEIKTHPEGHMPIAQKVKLESNSRYSIYPNPTQDNIAISYKGPEHKAALALYDITGRLLHQETLLVGYNPASFKLNELKAGVYILSVTDEKGKAEQFKIVKQ